MNKTNAAQGSIKRFAGVVAVAFVLAVSTAASAEILTFDTLSGTGQSDSLIPNGYGGLQWNNFGTVGSINSYYPGSGYETGTISGSNTAFNWYGEPASFSSATAFTLNDAYFTGAWNDGLQIHVVGTDGTNTYTKDFTVDTSSPVDILFNWSNINSVSFTSSGGTLHPGLIGAGTHFAMDNLSINEVMAPVPEPETYAMLLAGLCLIGFMARRREDFDFLA